MVDRELTSLVVYRMPMALASGIRARIISSWAATGSASEVPVALPVALPSASAKPAATGSLTAV